MKFRLGKNLENWASLMAINNKSLLLQKINKNKEYFIDYVGEYLSIGSSADLY